MPIPFLAPAIPFLLKPAAGWIAAGVAVLVLGAAVVWFRHEADVAERAQALAEDERDLARQDASRWQAASDVRDQRLANLGTVIEQQNADVEAARADTARLRASLDSVRRQNDRLSADLDQAKRDLAEEIQQDPGGIRDLGPIISKRTPQLFE